jgi:Asp-tRNA(Asn)/Glu-tRNA(Gln) amidotransferase A subunit family amidase
MSTIAQMHAAPLERLDAIAVARLIESGALTAEQVVRASLERIAEREATIGAWEHIDGEAALLEARRMDREGYRGPLHGVPVGVKDVIDTKGQPTRYGSPIYKDNIPTIDAACVAITRKAGGIILGKTVTAEFAHRYPGKTRNPNDPARTPGGSSSGSAAAVADLMVPLALGTQTTASTIRPASYCGIVGYRPTHNLMSCAGIKPSAPSFDTPGVLARTVADCAFYRDILLEQPVRRIDDDISRAPRIGFCRTPYWDKVDPRLKAALEDTAARLSRQGAHVRDITISSAIAAAAAAHRTISSWELARSLTPERLYHYDQLSAVLRDGKMAEGLCTTPNDLMAAVENLESARRATEAFFDDVDIVMAPSTGGIADLGLQSTGSAEFSTIWTALHVPAMTIPLSGRIDGMPVGAQFLTRRGADVVLGDIAFWVSRRLTD